ncbi:hypothetical protein YW3DRAFT_05831 [Streptomyces sp. MnatMP-M77]|nr:hypothetical protein YW3DRAFT_05831 [Streptomyces sp. MnatMP-M77]
MQRAQPSKKWHGRVPVTHVRGRHRDGKQQAECVGHDMPSAARYPLPAVVPARGSRRRGGRPHRLRVDDPGRRLRMPTLALTDPSTQPVVELCDQPVLPPPAEEGIDPAPGREVRGHRTPGDPARDQVADRVEHRAVAVALGLPAPAFQQGRHRHPRSHSRPFRVRHIRRVPAHPIRMISRVPVHVRERSTRLGSRVERCGRERVELRQQRLLELPRFGSHLRVTKGPLPSCAYCRKITPAGNPFDSHVP